MCTIYTFIPVDGVLYILLYPYISTGWAINSYNNSGCPIEPYISVQGVFYQCLPELLKMCSDFVVSFNLFFFSNTLLKGIFSNIKMISLYIKDYFSICHGECLKPETVVQQQNEKIICQIYEGYLDILQTKRKIYSGRRLYQYNEDDFRI